MISFIIGEEQVDFEHSLSSLSKWESINEKPFFRREGEEEMTLDELIPYYKCMVVSGRDELVDEMSDEEKLALYFYINSRMTATTVNEVQDKSATKEHITSELLYYYMLSFKIPFTCDAWHLNRLLTLIRVCMAKQEKPKKTSRAATANRFRELNAKRRAEMGTNG